MFDNTRTSARTLLIAATTAGFVALGGGLASADTLDRVANPGTVNKVANPGTVNKVANPGTVNKVANPGTVNKITAPGVADPDVSVPQVELPEAPEAPEVTAPDTNGVADSAQELADSADATVPQVNAPEPS
ncbi:MAG: hypothetical protein JK586_07580, partial [Nocardiopsis sp. BM-2018]